MFFYLLCKSNACIVLKQKSFLKLRLIYFGTAGHKHISEQEIMPIFLYADHATITRGTKRPRRFTMC